MNKKRNQKIKDKQEKFTIHGARRVEGENAKEVVVSCNNCKEFLTKNKWLKKPDGVSWNDQPGQQGWKKNFLTGLGNNKKHKETNGGKHNVMALDWPVEEDSLKEYSEDDEDANVDNKQQQTNKK